MDRRTYDPSAGYAYTSASRITRKTFSSRGFPSRSSELGLPTGKYVFCRQTLTSQQTSRIKRPNEIVSLKVSAQKLDFHAAAAAGSGHLSLPGDEKPLNEFVLVKFLRARARSSAGAISPRNFSRCASSCSFLLPLSHRHCLHHRSRRCACIPMESLRWIFAGETE